MPFVLILAGVVLIVSAVRNSQQQLFYLLALDFTGPHNFIFWFVSILIIGALGYIPKAKPLSDGFLILVILVLFLKKGSGFFDQFTRQIGSTTTASPHVSPTGSTSAGGGSATNISFGGSTSGLGGGISIGTGGGGGIAIGLPGRQIPGVGNTICDPWFDPYCQGGQGGFGGGGMVLPGFGGFLPL